MTAVAIAVAPTVLHQLFPFVPFHLEYLIWPFLGILSGRGFFLDGFRGLTQNTPHPCGGSFLE
jgi:hypothetical protein